LSACRRWSEQGAAGSGGVIIGIIMVFEMTRDYAVIVRVIVAVAAG
jgi:hypothetical protein